MNVLKPLEGFHMLSHPRSRVDERTAHHAKPGCTVCFAMTGIQGQLPNVNFPGRVTLARNERRTKVRASGPKTTSTTARTKEGTSNLEYIFRSRYSHRKNKRNRWYKKQREENVNRQNPVHSVWGGIHAPHDDDGTTAPRSPPHRNHTSRSYRYSSRTLTRKHQGGKKDKKDG
jgi:hypothetical protein